MFRALVILLLFPLSLQAQLFHMHKGEGKHDFVIVLAGHQSKAYTAGEISFARAYTEANPGGATYYQYGIGSEFFSRNGDTLILAPKISVEAALNLIGVRANLLYYTDLHSGSSIRFRPEIGFSGLGFFNVFYGYSIPLSNGSFARQSHTLSLQWNLFCGKRHFNKV